MAVSPAPPPTASAYCLSPERLFLPLRFSAGFIAMRRTLSERCFDGKRPGRRIYISTDVGRREGKPLGNLAGHIRKALRRKGWPNQRYITVGGAPEAC